MLTTIVVSVVVAAIANTITILAQRMISRHVSLYEQMYFLREYIFPREFSYSPVLTMTIMCLIIIISVPFNGLVTIVAVPSLYIGMCMTTLRYLYVALVIRYIDQENAIRRFQVECPGNTVFVSVGIAFSLNSAGGFLLDSPIVGVINYAALAILTFIMIWIVLGGLGRLWQRIKNKLKRLKPKPVLRPQLQPILNGVLSWTPCSLQP